MTSHKSLSLSNHTSIIKLPAANPPRHLEIIKTDKSDVHEHAWAPLLWAPLARGRLSTVAAWAGAGPGLRAGENYAADRWSPIPPWDFKLAVRPGDLLSLPSYPIITSHSTYNRRKPLPEPRSRTPKSQRASLFCSSALRNSSTFRRAGSSILFGIPGSSLLGTSVPRKGARFDAGAEQRLATLRSGVRRRCRW